jgi:putative hydrolase of the HAD superfamily
MERRFSGLILDWAGVLTTNVVDGNRVVRGPGERVGGLFLSRWADPRGQELYRRLEADLGPRSR